MLQKIIYERNVAAKITMNPATMTDVSKSEIVEESTLLFLIFRIFLRCFLYCLLSDIVSTIPERLCNCRAGMGSVRDAPAQTEDEKGVSIDFFTVPS